jgi:two-component system, sensor histidine kinase and response regulator
MHAHPRRLSIRAQVLGAVLVAVTVVAGALLIFFAQRQRGQATRALEARVAGTADMLAVGVALGLRSTDLTGISRAMAWARRDPAILWAVVVDTSDQPIARYAQEGAATPMPDFKAPHGRVVRRADVLSIAVPVLDRDERLGSLHLGVSMGAAAAEIRQDQRTAIAVVIGISMLATIFGVVVSRRISRPIELLRNAAVNVADGAVPEFPVRGSNETAELGQAFRAMSVRIRETLDVLTTQASELAESRDTALGATQAKSLFLATMSHELRTPMTGVLGMLDLLMRTSLSGKQLTFARTARDSADSLLVLIDEILDFSKIEAGKLSLEQVAFDPRAVAEDVAALLAERAHRKQLSLVCDVAADVPAEVIGDPTRMRQILLNLGGNAVKFTSSGEVRIEVRVESQAVTGSVIRFAIHDSGLGMADAAQAELFTAFTQAEASTTRRFGGTGLGLSICRGLVELMGGRIDVESTLGLGSVFTVSVPFTVSAAAARQEQLLHGRRVLLVHRASTQRNVVTTYLEDAGATVTSCNSVDDCAPAVRSQRPHLLVFEAAHSALPAQQLVAQLRELVGSDSTHVVLLVTLDSPVLLEDERAGAQALSLPVRRQSLLDACLSSGTQSATPRALDTHVARAASGYHVLVVEDNPVNRMIAEFMLRELGHSVSLAENGREALDLLTHTAVDLVLMDCQMPVLDGFGATAAIRRLEYEHRSKRLPIIALTANAVKGDREACVAAGMDDYMSKPYTRIQLADACSRWLQSVRSHVSNVAHTTDAAGDLDTLLDRLRVVLGESDDAFIRELLDHYLSATRAVIGELQAAAQADNRLAIHRLGHRLRGSSATICADEIAIVAGELESLPASADSETVFALINELEIKVGHLRERVHAG